MELNINMDDICMSNIEVLQIIERALHLDYENSYVQNGVVYRRAFNYVDGFIGNKMDVPEEVYNAYVTIRKYLLNENE